MMLARTAILLLLPSYVASAQVDSAQARGSRRMLGVFDGTTGDPIAGVQVRDAFSGATTVTSKTGTARLDFLSYRGEGGVVQLLKLGYEPMTVVVKSDTASITEIMSPVTELAPVVTTEHFDMNRDEGRWSGFESRCAEKTVTCFRASDLAAKAGDNMADFLVRAAGVVTGPCGASTSRRRAPCGLISMHSTAPQADYCVPTMIVDGYLWDLRSGTPIDLKPGTAPIAPFTPTNVKGVEVYPTGMPRPARFGGDPTCGMVVIWTK